MLFEYVKDGSFQLVDVGEDYGTAANEGHTPPAGAPRSGGNRVAGVCWAGPGNTNLARQMRFSATTALLDYRPRPPAPARGS